MNGMTCFLEDSLSVFLGDLAQFKDAPVGLSNIQKAFSDWITQTLTAWQAQTIGFDLKLVQYLELPLFAIQNLDYSLEIKLHAFKFIIKFLLFQKLEYLHPKETHRIVQTLQEAIYPEESDKKLSALLDEALLEVASILTSNLAKLSPESLQALFVVVLKRTEREPGNPLKTLLAQRAQMLLMTIVSKTFNSHNPLPQHCLELYACIIKSVKSVTTGQFLFQEQEERFWHIRLVQILQLQQQAQFYLMQNEELIQTITPLIDDLLIQELLVLKEQAIRAESREYLNICYYFAQRICVHELPRALELEIVLDILRKFTQSSLSIHLASQIVKNPLFIGKSLTHCSLQSQPSCWNNSIEKMLLSLQQNPAINFISTLLLLFKNIDRCFNKVNHNQEDYQLEEMVEQISEAATGKPKKFFQLIQKLSKKKGEELVMPLTGSILRYSPHIANSKLLLLLGADSKVSKAIIKEYLRTFDFSKLHPVLALRYFLSTFLLSGQAQYIDRVIQPFTHQYFSSNKEREKGARCLEYFPNEDNFGKFIYLLIFLHTSHHNPQLREKDRLSFQMFSKSAQDVLIETEEEEKVNQIGNFIRECFDNITLIESKPLDQGCVKLLSWDDKIGRLHFRDKQRITTPQIRQSTQNQIKFIKGLLLKILKQHCEVKLKGFKNSRNLLQLSKSGQLKVSLKQLIECSILFSQSQAQEYRLFQNLFISGCNQVLLESVVSSFFKPDLCASILNVIECSLLNSNSFILSIVVFLFSETNIGFSQTSFPYSLCFQTAQNAIQSIRQQKEEMANSKPNKSFTSFLMSYLTSDSLEIDMALLDEQLTTIKTHIVDTFYGSPKDWESLKNTVLSWMKQDQQIPRKFTHFCLELLRRYPDRLELLRLLPLLVQLLHNGIQLDQSALREIILDLVNTKKSLISAEKKVYMKQRVELFQSHKTVNEDMKHFVRFSQSFKSHLGAQLALHIGTVQDFSFKSLKEMVPTLLTKMIQNSSHFSLKCKMDSFALYLQKAQTKDSFTFKKTLNHILIFIQHACDKIARLNSIHLIETVSSLFHLIQSQENEKIILSILKKIIESPGDDSVSVFIKSMEHLIASEECSRKNIIQMLSNCILSLPGNLGTLCFPLLAKMVHEAKPGAQKITNFKQILQNLLTEEQVEKIESSESRFACFYFVHKAFSYFLEQESTLLDKDFMQTLWLHLLKAELREIEYYLGLKDDNSAFKVNESLKEQVSQLNKLDLLNKETLGEKYEVVQSALKQYIE